MIKMLFLSSVLTLGTGVVIDSTTVISLGEVGVVVGAVWYLGRKFQRLDDFMAESREWRKSVIDEQVTARERQEQILRHQEQARQRNERIWSQLEKAEEASKLYGTLLAKIDELRLRIDKGL